MKWTVRFHDKFESEFDGLSKDVQDELLAYALLLKSRGSLLGRPYVDTLNGSRFANMKELRFMVRNEVWRVAFAFDPKRQAILLVAGNKSGKHQAQFYRRLIKIADDRFNDYLRELKKR